MTHVLAALYAALLLQAPARGAAEGPRGSVTGVCLSAQTGEPVKSASVLLSGNINGQRISQAVLTRADGAFSFERLEAGAYSLNIEKTGYQQVVPVRPVVVSEKLGLTNLEIKLNRAAVISGRVTDPDAAPVIGAEVASYRSVWMNGRRTAVRTGVARTDDRGLYRLFGLPEGRYVIAASAPVEQQPAGEAEISLTRAFYPTGTRANEAAPLAVRWGQELGEINLVFRAQATFSVSGVVADAEAGGPCSQCVMRAASVDEPYGFSQRSFGVAPDGSYRIRGVAPGGYRIFAERMARPGRHIVSSRVVQVGNGNLTDVNLLVGLQHSVSGRVVFEPDPPATSGQSRPIGLQFASPIEMGASAIRVNPDYGFETAGLSAGAYTVRISNLPPGGYLKAIRIAGQELPRREIEVPEEGDVTQLELVVAFDSATLSGRIKPPDEAGQGHRVTAALIALFPQDNQSPFVVEQQAPSDANGGFNLTGIAPGSYTVFAFPQSSDLEWRDPDVRRRLQTYAKSLDLSAGKKETIELTIVPEDAGGQ